MATYLVRVNLDIKDSEDEVNSVRFLTASDSIAHYINDTDKVVILSHRGRPKGREEELSLLAFKDLFEIKLKKSVVFLDNSDLSLAGEAIRKSPPGSLFLLENLRFLSGENENDPKTAEKLALLGDIFINDDFATAHRENASNVGITEFIPSKMGPILAKEIAHLKKVKEDPEKPFILVIGGAKMADKIDVINSLIGSADKVLLGGGSANTLLKAKGFDVGGSIWEPEMMDIASQLVENPKIVLPSDYEKDGDKILDIGPKTIALYSEIIKTAKTVVWGGPMGYFEDERFSKGSYGIARAIADSGAFSVVGGGETIEIVRVLGLENKIGHISTGGGAMLDFLAGKKMPAIVALEKK